jgi:hypothetical protein
MADEGKTTEKEQLEQCIKRLSRQHEELEMQAADIRNFLGEGLAQVVNQCRT